VLPVVLPGNSVDDIPVFLGPATSTSFPIPELTDAGIDRLRSSGDLPDLTGRKVVFAGLGETVPPQPALGRRERARLLALRPAIATAGRATCTQVYDTLGPGSGPSSPPSVAVVVPGAD
jgi:hypothetical protein